MKTFNLNLSNFWLIVSVGALKKVGLDSEAKKLIELWQGGHGNIEVIRAYVKELLATTLK